MKKTPSLKRSKPSKKTPDFASLIAQHLPSIASLADSDEWEGEFGIPYSVSRVAGEDDRGILCYVRVRGRRERIPFKELVFDDYDPLSRIQRRYFREWEKEHPTPPLLRWIFEEALKETNRESTAKHRKKRQAPKTRRNK